MKINIRVKTNAKSERVEKTGKNQFKIWTKEPAKENKANLSIIKIISRVYKIPKSSVSLVRGLKSKEKVFEVDLGEKK